LALLEGSQRHGQTVRISRQTFQATLRLSAPPHARERDPDRLSASCARKNPLQANLARLLHSSSITRRAPHKKRATPGRLHWITPATRTPLKSRNGSSMALIEVPGRERTHVSPLVASQMLARPSLRKFVSGHDDIHEP